MVADADGVMVLPRAEAEALAAWAEGMQDFAGSLRRQVLEGQALGELSGASALVRRSLDADRA